MSDYIRGGKYDGMTLDDAFIARGQEIARLTAERDEYKEWHRIANETSEAWKDRYFKTQADLAAAQATLESLLASVRYILDVELPGQPHDAEASVTSMERRLNEILSRLNAGEALAAVREVQGVLKFCLQMWTAHGIALETRKMLVSAFSRLKAVFEE